MELDQFYTNGWLALLAGGLALEGAALLNKKEGDTLSEHVWAWLKGSNGQAPKSRRIALVAGMAWAAGHFISFGAV